MGKENTRKEGKTSDCELEMRGGMVPGLSQKRGSGCT